MPPEEAIDPRRNDPRWQPRLEAAVASELVRKGWRQRGETAADVRIKARLRWQDRRAESFGDYWWYWRMGGSQGPQGSFVHGFPEVTVEVEILDSQAVRILWQGSATTVVEKQADVDRLLAALPQMLDKVR